VKVSNSRLTRIQGCLIRDDRDVANAAAALEVSGGGNNVIADNLLDRAPAISGDGAVVRNNEVVARSPVRR
jgi:hypothetical protein